jgi:hypothetical protein
MPGGRQGALVVDVVERFGLVAFLYGVISVTAGGGARSSQPYLGPRGLGIAPAT